MLFGVLFLLSKSILSTTFTKNMAPISLSFLCNHGAVQYNIHGLGNCGASRQRRIVYGLEDLQETIFYNLKGWVSHYLLHILENWSAY